MPSICVTTALATLTYAKINEKLNDEIISLWDLPDWNKPLPVPLIPDDMLPPETPTDEQPAE